MGPHCQQRCLARLSLHKSQHCAQQRYWAAASPVQQCVRSPQAKQCPSQAPKASLRPRNSDQHPRASTSLHTGKTCRPAQGLRTARTSCKAHDAWTGWPSRRPSGRACARSLAFPPSAEKYAESKRERRVALTTATGMTLRRRSVASTCFRPQSSGASSVRGALSFLMTFLLLIWIGRDHCSDLQSRRTIEARAVFIVHLCCKGLDAVQRGTGQACPEERGCPPVQAHGVTQLTCFAACLHKDV